MLAVSDPNLLVAEFAVGGLVCAAFWRLIAWVRAAPISPDPWDAAVEQKLSESETQEICPHCSTPQSSVAWFCPHCGRAVGPYNNLMPYVQVFSEGEVFRAGASGKIRSSPLIVGGYLLLSFSMLGFFAPIFWIYFLKNQRRIRQERLSEPGTAGGPPA